MIILLLLLSTLGLSSTQAPPPAPTPVLKWTDCNDDVTCFCKEEDKPNILVAVTDPTTNAKIKCEEYGVQNKFFTQDSALFQMEIIGGEADDITKDSKIMIFEGDNPSFGCKKNEITGEVELEVTDPKMKKKYKMTLFEKRSVLEKGHVVCAIYMELAYKYGDVARNTPNMIPKVQLIHSAASSVLYELGITRMLFYLPHEVMKIKCDPFSFKDPSFSGKYHVRPIIQRDEDVLNCKGHDEKSADGTIIRTFTMKYDQKKEGQLMEELTCGAGQMYSLKQKKLNPDTNTEEDHIETVPSPESYTFYCAIDFNEVCNKPGECVPDGNKQCPEYKKGPAGQPATYECLNKKWLINNKYYELSAQPECKQEKYGNENNAAFYAKLPNSEVMITAEARCFTDYDCKIKSSLDLPGAKDEEAGNGVDKSNPDALRCADARNTMEVIDAESGATLNHTSYECDKATGAWYNDTDRIAFGSTVRCTAPPPVEEAAKITFTNAKVYTIIGGTLGVVLLLIVVVSGIYCLVSNRKRKIKRMEKAEWVKLKKPERIKKCIEDFALALVATPEACEQIFVGLNDIEMLLETGTEDLKAWDGAYMFLIRLLAFIPKTDQQIWHMMNRYLLIQAQKIIHRHGWLTKEPITNSKRKGLIRTVAIRLLSLAMFDDANMDAKKMLWRAWRRLGFNGVSQYPHAGVLWNVVMHTRPVNHIQLESKRSESFNYVDFTSVLHDIATNKAIEMPKEDIIPEFGSVQCQAAYAIGGTPHYRIHDADPDKADVPNFAALIDKAHADPTRDRDVPMAYWAGLCDTLAHNPLVTVLEAVEYISRTDKYGNLINQMWEIKPETEWAAHIKRAQKLVHYYGASNDAQRLQGKFIKENPTFGMELFNMQKEQRDFEAAVVKVKEQLREWLRERTDNEEFKKKPVYLKGTDQNKLDDTVGDFVEPPKGCTDSSKDGSSQSPAPTGSNSNSAAPGSSGSKSAENDPAAGAAAASSPAASPSSSDAAAAPAKP